MNNRLSDRVLHALSQGVLTPSYDRARMLSGIVHLGAGAFHRTHQAVYTDDVMAAGDLRWGIVAASLRSPVISQALAPQDRLYTLLVSDNGQQQARVIGSLAQVWCLAEARERLQARLASPLTHIVSLTITEKGYCYEPATGGLDEMNADVAADLAGVWTPRTAIGLLAAAIYQRKRNGVQPFTLLSCDNLPSNGVTLRRVLQRYLELAQPAFGDPTLSRYFLDHYACPCTMVDRITPATTTGDQETVQTLLGVCDASPVVAEPFSQWVIQDEFSSLRPAWEDVGATLTSDVAAFEEMKLRMLNGSHSALAYLGGLAGYATVADAMKDEALAGFIDGLMDDAIQTLNMPTGIDLIDYKRSLLRRFGNTSLKHLTAQIAMDGSQKLPQRILEPLSARLAQGLSIERHALVVAAWMRYLMGRSEQGAVLAINDPMAAELTAAVSRAGGRPEDVVRAVMAFSRIFDSRLAHDPVLTDSVVRALTQLLSDGTQATLAAYAYTRS